jgi:signal peptidase II
VDGCPWELNWYYGHQKNLPDQILGSLTPWLGIAAIVILIDQLTKITITKTFQLGEEKSSPRSSTWCWPITRARPSASCDSGGWQRYFFTAIGIGAAIFIVYLLKKHGSQRMFAGRCR